MKLLFHGCPIHAIVIVFDIDFRTVSAWISRFGVHCEELHEELVAQNRPHDKVEADELWSKRQGGKFWITSALASTSRLWLGGNVGLRRDTNLIYELCVKIVRCVDIQKPLLIVTDGLSTYASCLKKVFRQKIPRNGRTGRCSFKLPQNLLLIQCVKSLLRKVSALFAMVFIAVI